MSEAWSQWQGQLIDGKFHLKQYLGGSGQSAVFLAHLYPSQARANDGSSSDAVAIRLIANSANAELQLSRWRMAQSLSHPHLIQILDTGRCRLGEIDLIFAVMEYGEENLSQIVPQRPLTVPEAREMLEPTLDALTYLHSHGLVHAHLKPANIMAIGETLKLASDGICPADQPVSAPVVSEVFATTQQNSFATKTQDIYDAPETSGGIWSPAGDVWSLGMTLSEILTQRLPSEDSRTEEAADPLLPENLPVQFVEIVRGCLRRDLQLRWTIPAIKARLHAVSAARPLTTHIANSPAQSSAETATVTSSGAFVGAGGPVSELSKHQDVSRPAMSQERLESSPGDESGRSASAAALTFAEALRRKPVASEKTTMVQEPIALHGTAGGASPGTRGTKLPESSDRTSVGRQPRMATSSAAIAVAPEQADEIAGVIEPAGAQAALATKGASKHNSVSQLDSQEPIDRVLDFVASKTTDAFAVVVETRTALQRLLSRIMPIFVHITSQTIASIQSQTAHTMRRIRDLASKIEARLGPYPGQTILRLAVAVLVAAAAIAAMYSGVQVLRHKSRSVSKHEVKTPPASVTAVKPDRKASSKKRASVAQAKPRPGSPLSAAPQANARAAQPSTGQAPTPNIQPASPQSNTQVPALKAEARPTTQPESTSQSLVRRIDDGGAEDESSPPIKAGGGDNHHSNAESAGISPGIAQQVLPQVSRSALHTIHGTVRVSVRVKVDRSGNVAGAELASAGPSRYFARKSLEAAQSWKFAPGRGSPFLLHFEFRNNGARAFATRVGS